MGTNYYLHIGKRSAHNNGHVFSWAIDPDMLQHAGESVIVTNEYGDEISLSDFADITASDSYDMSNIGQPFS